MQAMPAHAHRHNSLPNTDKKNLAVQSLIRHPSTEHGHNGYRRPALKRTVFFIARHRTARERVRYTVHQQQTPGPPRRAAGVTDADTLNVMHRTATHPSDAPVRTSGGRRVP